MRLLLEIKQEKDLQLLLQLLERLNISYRSIADKPEGENDLSVSEKASGGPGVTKNYDAEEINDLLTKIQEEKVFAEISDPVAWQKQLRDEWQ